MKYDVLFDESLTIVGLSNDAQGCDLEWVGKNGVTRIEVVSECGQMARVPWFAVYRGDVLFQMFNAAQVGSVIYAAPTKEETP